MKNIIFGDSLVSFSDSIYITLISMGIVFSVLILISIFVSFMKYIPEEKEKKKKNVELKNKKDTLNEKIKPETIDYEDENVRLAIMVASMEAAGKDENISIKIHSVKEIL